jgi:hypothetical protein
VALKGALCVNGFEKITTTEISLLERAGMNVTQ